MADQNTTAAFVADESVPWRRYLPWLIIAVLTWLTIIAVAISWRRQHVHDMLLDSLDQRLRIACHAIPEILQPDFHDRARTADAITPAEHRANIEALSRFCDANGFKFLYTVVVVEGQPFLTATNATAEELAEGSAPDYFLSYDEASPRLLQVYEQGGIAFDNWSDRWGSYRSCFVAKNSPGGQRYVAAADFPSEYVHTMVSAEDKRSLLIGLLIGLSIVPAALVIILLQRQQMRSLNSSLRQRLQTARQLRNRDQQLRESQKLDAVGRLAGGIAHEFNNTLTGVIGFAERIAADPRSSDKAKRSANLILESSINASTLTKQLLAFSRRRQTTFTPTNICELVEECTSLPAPSVTAPGSH